MTDEQILNEFLKEDAVLKSNNLSEIDLTEYRNGIKNTYWFQSHLYTYRLKESLNAIEDEINKLPFFKRIYAKFQYWRLMKKNLNK